MADERPEVERNKHHNEMTEIICLERYAAQIMYLVKVPQKRLDITLHR